MNIVLHGIAEERAQRIAARYGFVLCRSLEGIGDGNSLVLLPMPATDAARIALFARMQRLEEPIAAVVAAVGTETLSLLRYYVRPEKFHTVNADAEDGLQEYELSRIVETYLGLVCAHEGI